MLSVQPTFTLRGGSLAKSPYVYYFGLRYKVYMQLQKGFMGKLGTYLIFYECYHPQIDGWREMIN